MAALASALVLAASPASAQSAPTSIAEQLFIEGRTLMQEKKYAQACEKFKASYALDGSAYGTLLNLALCHEATNKPASAWTEFRVVISNSVGKREERVALAREHEAKLHPILSYLKIVVPPAARAPGLTVRVDNGSTFEEAAYGVEVPIDPGKHTIEASAPGKTALTREVVIGDASDHKSITLDPLADAPRPAPIESPADAEDAASKRTRRVIGVAMGGAGLAAIGGGLVFGLVAKGRRDDAENLCPDDGRCTSPEQRDTANERMSSASSMATVSNILVGAGAVIAVSGVVLFLTAQPSKPAASSVSGSTSIAARPTSGGAALLLQGSF